MRLRHGGMVLTLIGCLSFLGWSVTWAEPSFEVTAHYILDIVKAFRTAYVLHVVEHTRAGGLSPREDWEGDAHLLPLPAQFVKAAASQVQNLEIGLISLTPVNPENRPRTARGGRCSDSSGAGPFAGLREFRRWESVQGDVG